MIQEFITELNELIAEHDTAVHKLNDAERYISELQTKLSDSEKMNMELGYALSEQEKIINELEDEITSWLDEIERLKSQTPPDPETWVNVQNFSNTTISTRGDKLVGSEWVLPDFAEGAWLNNSTAEYQDKRYAYQEIIGTDLKAWNINDDPNRTGTSRAQTTIRVNKPLEVIHMSYDFTLHPDLAHLQMFPDKFSWFSLLEFWGLRDDSMTGDVAGSARWTLGIKKDSVTDKIYWGLTAEYMQPEEKRFDDFFPTQKNRIVPVTFGERATLDIWFKPDSTGNGRIIITLDGQILFDVTGYTQYPNRPDLYVRGLTFYKLYTSDTILDWMRGEGKEVSILYHNFKWYKT